VMGELVKKIEILIEDWYVLSPTYTPIYVFIKSDTRIPLHFSNRVILVCSSAYNGDSSFSYHC
jgi:hypothetical protein